MRLLITVLSLALLSSMGFAKETTLIDFSMQDQFDQEYNQNSFDGKVIIMLAADREGSDYTSQWGSALGDSLSSRGQIETVKFVPLSTLQGVPSIMKKMIKGFFPKEKESWVLMDWDGAFANAYEFTPKTCNIVVFDTDKNLLIHKAVTELEEETVVEILDSLN